MASERHYVVCLRCGTSTCKPFHALAETRLARSRQGELVVHAVQPTGCRVCGAKAVEVVWGIPAGDALPWTPRNPRVGPWRDGAWSPMRLRQ